MSTHIPSLNVAVKPGQSPRSSCVRTLASEGEQEPGRKLDFEAFSTHWQLPRFVPHVLQLRLKAG